MKTILVPLYIALRFHKKSQKNKIISFISIISIIGTSLGIIILIISLSAINGFNTELNERILSIIPHGEIEKINSKFYNWPTIIKKIQKIPGIVQAIPYIKFSGLIEIKNKFYPIQIYGISALHDIHPKAIAYLSSIKTLKNFSPNKSSIILGKGISDTLDIQKDEWINILIHNANLKNNSLHYKKIHVQVIDILDLKSYLDHNITLIPLFDAQKYINQKNDISGINIKVNNILHIENILHQVKKIINKNVTIRSWIDIYNFIYQDIQIIRTIIYLTITLITIIACFSMVCILTLIIKEKKYDIAILSTLGAKNYLIFSILIWYSFLNSAISILIGSISGTLISLNLTEIFNILEKLFRLKILNNNFYFINFLPSELHIKDIIFVSILEIFLSFLATLYPIIRANRIEPAKILK